MQHFLLPDLPHGNRVEISDSSLLHQMKNVLRFKVGQELVVMNGLGLKVKARVETLHKKGAVIELGEREQCAPPSRRVRLICALSKKPSTFEWIVQKATELGVTDIVPLVSARCQVRELRKQDRLDLILKEAAEQSENAFPPKLHDAIQLSDFLASGPSGELLAGDAREHDGFLKDMPPLPNQDVNLLIGPEGGFTEEELDAIRHAGGKIFLLGEGILRMETAAIAALSLIQFS